jgi:hypothetical protein
MPKGLQGLKDDLRSGPPPQLPADLREQILRVLEEPAGENTTSYTGQSIGFYYGLGLPGFRHDI